MMIQFLFWTTLVALQFAGGFSFTCLSPSSTVRTSTSVVSIQQSKSATHLCQSLSENEEEQAKPTDQAFNGLLVSRRSALVSTLSAIAATTTSVSCATLIPQAAVAYSDEQSPITSTSPQAVPISAQWKAVDGLNSADKQFVSYDTRPQSDSLFQKGH